MDSQNREEVSGLRLHPGNMLGAYSIESIIAQGGMGTVYHAMHVRLGRTVALKVLSSDYKDQKELISRFLTEAHAVNQIDHENIVEITDFVSDRASGMHYIVMEFLKGLDLLELLDSGVALNIERVLTISIQIASALQAAHEAGIIHRDLKPDNIFLTERHNRKDFVKILDFGVAKLREDQVMFAMSTHKTTPGTMLGTPKYMSPEQACAKTVDHRTDVYSLGVILYQMVTGRVPFDGRTIAEILGQQMDAAAVPPSRYADLPQPVPPQLEALIQRCLAKEPQDRPPSMIEVKRELEEVQANITKSSGRSALPRPLMIIGVLMLLAITAMVSFGAGWCGHASYTGAQDDVVQPLPAGPGGQPPGPMPGVAPQQPAQPNPGLGGWGKQPTRR